ncbi:MAG: ParB/RepB/Spo0J family partition protein [Polyangiales bacterium]
MAAIEDVFANKDQPRRYFDPQALTELADSIRAHGLLEPILVRRRQGGGYEIIAGERRWRASQSGAQGFRSSFASLTMWRRSKQRSSRICSANLNPIEAANAFTPSRRVRVVAGKDRRACWKRSIERGELAPASGVAFACAGAFCNRAI